MKKTFLPIICAVSILALVSISCMTLTLGSRGPIQFDPASLPDASVGTEYAAEISISGNDTPAGDVYVSEGALPPGLELKKKQAEDVATIRGTPTTAGTYTFSVYVWCYGTNVSGQVGEREYTIVVR